MEGMSCRCRAAVRASLTQFSLIVLANGEHQNLTVFSLGHFQWCICKYEDGPCLDFSGGMFTVSYIFEIMLQICLLCPSDFVFCVITLMNREISG